MFLSVYLASFFVDPCQTWHAFTYPRGLHAHLMGRYCRDSIPTALMRGGAGRGAGAKKKLFPLEGKALKLNILRVCPPNTAIPGVLLDIGEGGHISGVGWEGGAGKVGE